MMDRPTTRSRRAVLTGFAAIALATVALPASAGAETFCVNKSPCLGGESKPSLQAALLAAKQHAGEDDVEIGPSDGPYSEGALVYGESASNPVHITYQVGFGSAPGSVATIVVLGRGNSTDCRWQAQAVIQG